MTKSRPSFEIYAVDVPEVKDFSAGFRYNFFVPDESVNDSGGVPENVLLREAEDVDSQFIQYATTRAPRLVVFNWSPSKLSDVGREVTDQDVRNNIFFRRNIEENLISNNLDKVVTEDHFASYNFVSVQFHDNDIDDKVHYLVSGSFEQHTLNDENSATSHSKAASRLRDLLPHYIEPHFLTRAMSQMAKATGTSFYSSGESSASGKKNNNTKHTSTKAKVSVSKQQKTLLLNTFFNRLKDFQINAQINGKLFYDVVNRTINDPNSSYGDDLHGLHQISKQISMTSKQRFSLQVQENDFKTLVPFVSLQVRRTAHHTDRRSAQIVGYLIDKTEVTRDGRTQQHPPIVVDSPRVSTTADFKVRYNSTYIYTIRSVACLTLPAIDDDTGDAATIQVLVSSRPSNKVYVKAVEQIPPPPPCDVDFTWNYETNNLMISWAFPPNSQRDIKKFQIFRRKLLIHPFELIKMYDFDDSLIKYEDNEFPLPSVVEYIKSPTTFFVDDEFNKQSKYIYTIAAIDAHGMTSNYSAQYEVWFDLFKNRLEKKLISHTGAPKPYPNLYLESDTFVDTMRVSGPHSKRMKVYFNPEFYHLYDDNDRFVKILSTKQTGGEYRIQMINVDNHKSQQLTIKIDDKTKAARKKGITPGQYFGDAKKLKNKI